MFVEKLIDSKLYLTFDDVLILPMQSNIEPKDVNLKTKASKGVEINIPIISAAMDTVTTSKMAIALAIEGGMGVIHRNMSISNQIKEVKDVKDSEKIMVVDVVSVSPEDSIYSVKILMEEENVGGVPVVDDKRRVVGILSKRDIRALIEAPHDIKVKEVMTKDVVTVNKAVSYTHLTLPTN